VRRIWLALVLLAAAAILSSCVEEISPGSNNPPKVWFTKAPKDGREIFSNQYEFTWTATDTDDDLGMGQTYVSLVPATIDTFVVSPIELANGAMRVYTNIFTIGQLPDTVYTFSVTVTDGRGATTTLDRTFRVRFDDLPPIVDYVECPPAKPTSPVFQWTFVIHAHDEAPNPSSASPEDSLTFQYRYLPPSGATSIEVMDFQREYKTLKVDVDGQTYRGTYKFRAKARDRAGNVSTEYVCSFEISGPK